MEKFSYTIHIFANNKEESLQIMKAITYLIKKIPPGDLTHMAELCDKKPGWHEKAKKYEWAL